MKKSSFIILILTIVLGGFIRFYGLSDAPVSPNWDEVSHGYNAYSILKTGKDEWGISFPAIFRSYGDFKLPVYIYSTILPVLIFGLNTFSVRFVSALAGTLAIWGIYLFTNELFKKKDEDLYDKSLTPGHIAALFLALLPWHIFLSRPALEANLALTLTIFGFYFLLRSHQKPKSLIYSAILLGLSVHTYNSYRVFIPLALVSYFIFFIKKIKFNYQFFRSALVLFLFFGIMAVQFFSGDATARYQKLKILSPSLVYQIGQNRLASNYPPQIARLIHNRPIYFIKSFTENYLSYFSSTFLNQSKGAQYQFAIPGQSLLGIPLTILFILGLVSLFASPKSPVNLWLISLFIFFPIAASLTSDPPQAIRPSVGILIVPIVCFLGLTRLLFSFSKLKNILFYLTLASLVFSSCFYLKNYWWKYQTKYSSSWQYGYQEAVSYINENKHKYKNVFITKKYGEPHMFYSFFSSLDPNVIQNESSTIRFKQSDWYWTDRIENIYFLNDWEIPSSQEPYFILESGHKIPSANSLLVTSPDHMPGNANLLKVINFLDGSPAFIIMELQ